MKQDQKGEKDDKTPEPQGHLYEAVLNTLRLGGPEVQPEVIEHTKLLSVQAASNHLLNQLELLNNRIMVSPESEDESMLITAQEVFIESIMYFHYLEEQIKAEIQKHKQPVVKFEVEE